MPVYKHTLKFAGVAGSTWDELYYSDSADVAAAAALWTQARVNSRLSCLNYFYQWRSVRISLTTGTKLTGQVSIAKQGQYRNALKKPSEIPPASPGWAVILRLVGKTGGSRFLWMRGLPSGEYTDDPGTGVPTIPDQLRININDWLLKLQGAAFGVVPRTKANPGSNPVFKVTTVNGAVAGQTVLTLDSAPGWVKNDTIIVSRFSSKDYPKLNGLYTILAATGTAVTVPYTTPEEAAAPITVPTGIVRKFIPLALSVIDYAGSNIDRLGQHDTKTSNFGSRGAKRAKRDRLSP